ncbi:hypothetical protein BURC_04807 [Burkholderiaceae bacterium]|nr:hypothetical protein BURC_04807 [Burkholderiaceae bacterium]
MNDKGDHTVSRVPRIIVLTRLMWRCSFCIFAVLAGNAVLMAVPQAREALQGSLAPRADDVLGLGWRQFPFLAAFIYWALSAWLVTRLLLSRKFDRDALGVPRADAYVNWVAAMVPRVLAFLALLPVTLLTVQINRWLGLITGLFALATLTMLVLRTPFGDVTEENSYGSFTFMGPMSRHAVWGFMALSATLLAGLWSRPAGLVVAMLWMLGAVGLWAWNANREWPNVTEEEQRKALDAEAGSWILPSLSLLAAAAMLALTWTADDEIQLARMIGSPALLLFALGSWTMFGGFVLTYLPLSWRWVGLAPWLPLALFVASAWQETHFVAQRTFELTAPVATSARESASERFRRWVDQVHAGDPVYMVAAVGGASRAAYWTGSVLAAMEDDARRDKRPFAANLFAISSISGASLGATAFVAGIAQFPDMAACVQSLPEGTPSVPGGCLSTRLQGFLERDFLAPVFGRMLFPDLFIRFVPVPVPKSLAQRADRSLGLEEAWAGDWRRQFGKGAVEWNAPIPALYEHAERGGPPRLPLLLLNTVRLEDGARFMQSVARPDWPGVTDLLHSTFDTGRLSLAQAVHNSARFPYVSPGALVLGVSGSATPPRDKQPELGRLGDGAYHEGSGAATLADVMERLVAEKLLRALPARSGLWACPGGWDDTDQTRGCAGPSPVVAIILDNSPSSFPADYVRGLDGRDLDALPGVAPSGMLLPEALGPVFGGLSTRTQLSLLSQRRLSRLVGSDPSSLIELRMPLWRATSDHDGTKDSCRNRGVQPSMNWYLDDCSRKRLAQASRGMRDPQVKPTLAEQALLNNLGRLRQLVNESGETVPGSKR